MALRVPVAGGFTSSIFSVSRELEEAAGGETPGTAALERVEEVEIADAEGFAEKALGNLARKCRIAVVKKEHVGQQATYMSS